MGSDRSFKPRVVNPTCSQIVTSHPLTTRTVTWDLDPVSTRLSAKGDFSMTTSHPKCYIGIDIAKATFDVFILPAQQPLHFNNDPNGITQFMSTLASFPSPLL